MASAVTAPSTNHTGAESSQLRGLVKTMDDMRKLGALCDVTLVVQGRHFSVHRLVLAAGSEFFRLLFTTNMMESWSPDVTLQGLEPRIVELLIDYIYTAQIELTAGNAQSLLRAANQLQVVPVKVMCEEFLKERLDVTNCMGMWALAHQFVCEGLETKAEAFLLRHFTQSSMSTDFLQLHVTCLTKILGNDKLSVSEEQLYDAALRWLKHDLTNRQQHLVEVLSCVRLPLLSEDFLSQTVQSEPLIADSPQCLSMVSDAVNYHLNWSARSTTCRPRLKRLKRIALFGHLKPDPCRYFNPKVHKWTPIHCSLERRWNATAVHWNEVVYIMGGLTCHGLIKRVDCYDIPCQKMYSRMELPLARNKLAACVSQGKIYISGGMVQDGSPVDLFESFDTSANSWQVETKLLTSRCCHGSVEVGGLIYVCGGVMSGDFRITNACEAYNPSTRQWMELKPMKKPRKNHGVAVVGGTIYAVGGKGQKGARRSVERYDVSGNYWHPCESMPYPLMVKCAAVGGAIYVLAGKGKEPLRRVLKYNTRTDKWLVCHSVQAAPYSGSVVCMVD